MEINHFRQKTNAIDKRGFRGSLSILRERTIVLIFAACAVALVGKTNNKLRPPFWKRWMDLAVPILSLPLLLPIFLIIAFWIKTTSRGKVFFQQERIGLNGEKFSMFKFRSMTENGGTGSHDRHVTELIKSGKPMVKLDALGDNRLIPGARFLRSTGLDELPQLFNVARGEMSIVGPRPCTETEYDHYTLNQQKRFGVLPGITGYWQVKGKNHTSFDEMIAMDEHYVGNLNPLLDLLIILGTPAVLFLQMLDLLESKFCHPGAVATSNKASDSLKN